MRMWEAGRAFGNAIVEGVGRIAGRVQETRPLSADLLESDEAYLAVFDAPGASQTDVQVRFVDGAVHVRIDRFREFHEGFEMRFPGRGLSLDGRVDLPRDDVDAEAATATLKSNGTLHVRIPKRRLVEDESPDERTVEVTGGPGDADEPTESGADEVDIGP